MTTNIYEAAGTPKVWKSTGGDGLLTFTSVANAAGRVGQRVDLGALPRPTTFRWYAESQFQASGLAIGLTCDVYLAWWNDDTLALGNTAGEPDGVVSASDSAISSANALYNLHRLGSMTVDSTSGATTFAKSGEVWIPVRYVSPVWWNATGATASATATVFNFTLTPIYPQSQ